MYTLFIADDHTVLRNGLKRIIEENSGYKVIGETGDGLEIVRQLRKLGPDMIILDISMPNLRGIEAVNKIRKFNKKRCEMGDEMGSKLRRYRATLNYLILVQQINKLQKHLDSAYHKKYNALFNYEEE